MKNTSYFPTKLYFFQAFRRNMFCVLAALFLFSLTASAQSFPAGFSQVKISNIYYPTSMAMAPDGRIFVTEKAGKVKIVKNGVVLSTPFLLLNVDQLNERGLSSIVLDPNFSTNHYVYIYYTTASSPIRNRLSRFTANGDVAAGGSEVKILDFEPLVNSIHNGGGMAFGSDGKLYLAVGNDNVNSYSQDLSNYKGKLLRINPDGSAPSGNPFSGSESAKRIWAFGFRNPWTIDIQAGTGRIYVGDVGENSWEEINNAMGAGKNFGWPGAEGMSGNTNYTNPVYAYAHGSSGTSTGCAITGGAFFNPGATNYPQQYIGKYFFIDYCNHWINYLDPVSGQKSNFATNLGSALNYLKVGTDGNLYYFSISSNALYKISYSGNNAPVITTQPVNESVAQGQNVTFNVSVSGATPLTFQWKKNGTDISGTNASSYTISNVQASHAGQYSVKVTNNYGNVTSNQATLTVTNFNANPVATINTPTSGTFYHAGDNISFSGSATDKEDGSLPASAFKWIVEFHHDVHLHPGPTIPTGVKSGSFPISTTGEASANVYYRLLLIVKDSGGLVDTAYVDILPVKSTITLNTVPSGLKLLLNGQPHTTSYSVAAVSGSIHTIDLSNSQLMNNSTYVFDYWQHGGNAFQNITITDNNTTYTAVFKENVNSCQTPIITPTGPTTFCSGSVTLKSSTAQGNLYQWKKDGVKINGATNSSYTASSAGDYQVKVTNGSCVMWSAPITVKIKSGLRASITPGGPTKFCTNGSVMLYGNTCSGYSYQWKKNGANINGATSATYLATSSGSYQLKVTQNSVSAWSSPLTVSENDCKMDDTEEIIAGTFSTEANSFQLNVYPNPNNGLFTIAIDRTENTYQKIQVALMNMLGQVVYNGEFEASDNSFKTDLELDNLLPSGIYSLQVAVEDRLENTTIILSRTNW